MEEEKVNHIEIFEKTCRSELSSDGKPSAPQLVMIFDKGLELKDIPDFCELYYRTWVGLMKNVEKLYIEIKGDGIYTIFIHQKGQKRELCKCKNDQDAGTILRAVNLLAMQEEIYQARIS